MKRPSSPFLICVAAGVVAAAVLLSWPKQDVEALVLRNNRENTQLRREALWKQGAYDESGFERMPPVVEGDWLWSHPEAGQTFQEFQQSRFPLRPSGERRRIVLQPLLPLGPRAQAALEAIRVSSGLFFTCEARIAEPIELPKETLDTTRGQYHAPKLLAFLSQRRPKDALVYAGVADLDLFTPTLNFVFGMGNLGQGIGVYSLTRFNGPRVADPLFLARTTGLLNHEIGHTFGLYHCVYYRCVMNGCNSLEEMDRTPKHFCPLCLRKLAYCLGFDPKRRYRRLIPFYEQHRLSEQAAFAKGRLQYLTRAGKTAFWPTETQ